MVKGVSAAILYDSEKRLLLQKRGIKDRRFEEEWSFFGGCMEGKETPEQTLQRKIQEELCYEVKRFSRFETYEIIYEEKKVKVNFYLVPFSDISQFKLQEGDGMRLYTIDEALELKMMPHDKKVIEDLKKIF